MFLPSEELLWCSTNTYGKTWEILTTCKTEGLNVKNWTSCPDPKPPSPARARAGTNSGGGGDFLAISSVPDAFVEFSQWPPAPWSLLRGLYWNHRFRPLCGCVRLGPCCGASAGTTGSSPLYACRPWSVVLVAFAAAPRPWSWVRSRTRTHHG